jgi:hypothetical protein
VIIPRLKKIFAKSDPALGYFSGELLFWLGWRQARKELESFLKEQPKNYLLIGDLALTDMGLGDRTAALALAERAMAVNPIEKDTLTGPVPIEILARVAAWTGGTRPRHHRFTKTALDAVHWRTGCGRAAAYSGAASARSNVRSALE